MVPAVAIETFGSWGPSGLKFLVDIGARIALATEGRKCQATFSSRQSRWPARGETSLVY